MGNLRVIAQSMDYFVKNVHDGGVMCAAKYGSQDPFFKWGSVFCFEAQGIRYNIGGLEDREAAALGLILRDMALSDAKCQEHHTLIECPRCNKGRLIIATTPPINETDIGSVRSICPKCLGVACERQVRWLNRNHTGRLWLDVVETSRSSKAISEALTDFKEKNSPKSGESSTIRLFRTPPPTGVVGVIKEMVGDAWQTVVDTWRAFK